MTNPEGDRLRIGLIGTGFWADQCHAAAIDEHGDLDFVGIWGRDPDKALELAGRHGTVPFSSADELFAATDAIVFAVPPAVQAELAPRAAAAGCHLLLEKPIATSSSDAWRIAQACADNGVQSAVNFSLLWGGATGPWLDEVVAPVDWDGGSVTILGDLRVTESPFSASPWRRLDNGSLWDVGPHAFSLLVAALGPVTDLHAEHGRGDGFVITLRHRDGGISTATLSYSLGAGSGEFRVEFWGAEGLVTPPAVDADADVSPAASAAPALDALLAAIRSGRATKYDAEFGAQIVDLLARADSTASSTAH
ncbi:MAG TPA: Gfo/Idh/MocA family oxidoreductase [Pseudolysinimonas sp.]|jgi:predicted dehydrogenase